MSHISLDMDVSRREMRLDTSIFREICDILFRTEGVPFSNCSHENIYISSSVFYLFWNIFYRKMRKEKLLAIPKQETEQGIFLYFSFRKLDHDFWSNICWYTWFFQMMSTFFCSCVPFGVNQIKPKQCRNYGVGVKPCKKNDYWQTVVFYRGGLEKWEYF